jgi:peptide/nickel transport system permease protein
MRLLGYAARRVALMPVQIFVVLLFTFVLSRLAKQSPVYQVLGTLTTPDDIERMTHQLGLDQPIYVQFWRYLGRLIRGDFGTSIVTGSSVLHDITSRLAATLELITISLFLAVVIGVTLGVLTAMSENRATRGGTTLYGMLAGSFPDFVVGLFVVYIFFVLLHWAPAPIGQLDPTLVPPRKVTGAYLLDSIIDLNWATFKSSAAHLVLPVLTMLVIYTGGILKITRTTVRELSESDILTFARAAGLSRTMVMWYALRNALPAIVTIIGITYGYLLGATVLVEKVFGWGGVGLYSVQAIQQADFAGIQGFVIFATLFSLVIYLLVDLVNAFADPRVRY